MRETKAERALRLLTLVIPFLDTGHDCLVCGADEVHEPDCFVVEVERLTGKKVLTSGEQVTG